MLTVRCGCFQVMFLTTCLAAGVTTSSSSFAEQEMSEEESILDLTLGGGIGYAPDYEGSDDYELGVIPYAELALHDGLLSLSVEGLEVALPIGESAFIGISLGYDEGRDEDENDALDGLGDVDDTVVGNVTAGLALGPIELGLAFSQDLGSGHEGYLVAFGADTGFELIEDKFEIGIGTGITWASQNYTEAFFGISADQAAASDFDRYDVDAGFKSAGIEVGTSYALTPNTYLLLEAGYLRLLGDAADSPIVDDRGSPNQFFAGLLLGIELGVF